MKPQGIHQMKVLSYPAYDRLEIAEHPLPDCADDEVLLKVEACGICGSELETFKTKSARRKPPLIMGHEFCGEIVAKGKNVDDWQVGTIVVSNSVTACGTCKFCTTKQSNLCVAREVFGMHRNGAFAEYVNVPTAGLLSMSPDISFREACLAEPLANGVHMVHLSLHLQLENVLIIGAGSIGLMAQQAFQAIRNVNTIVTDLKTERLDVAQRLGAKAVINTSAGDLYEQLQDVTQGKGIDLAVDAVGSPHTIEKGLQVVRSGGTLMIVGLHENSRSLSSYDIVLTEKKVIGSYAATQRDMLEALHLIASGKVDVSSWVNYYGLDDGVQAFNNMMEAKGNHIKSVLVMDKKNAD